VNGEASHLASDVPQGYIYGANGIGRHRPIHLPHAFPDGTAIQRVGTDDGRFDKLDKWPGISIGSLSGGTEKGMAFDPFIGVHRDHP
jgi:hypothetical protein